MSKREGRRAGGSGKAAYQAFMRRVRTPRKEKKRILIVGEGEKTEPNYFSALCREDNVRLSFAVTVKEGSGYNQEAVVTEAIGHKRKAENREEGYDEVWCVLDVESMAKRDSLIRAIELAQDNDIRLCLSNPAFEVWLLFHFEQRSRWYRDCDAVIQRLSPHWRRLCKMDYAKGDEHIYRRLHGLRDIAIGNAEVVWKHHQRQTSDPKVIDCNASTEVHRLVRYLLGGNYEDSCG